MLVSTYKQQSVLESKDEHEEIIIDEYLPRLFAPATANWLYCECSPYLHERSHHKRTQESMVNFLEANGLIEYEEE